MPPGTPCLISGHGQRHGEAGTCTIAGEENVEEQQTVEPSADVARQEPGNTSAAAPCSGTCPWVALVNTFHISGFLFLLLPFVWDLLRVGPSPNTCLYSD